MEEEYPYTQLEFAKLLGLSKAGLISRRKAGKLEGQYIVKDKCYFYARLRPDQVKHTPKKHTKRQRRRGVSYTGEKLKYRNVALQNHNEMKMLLKLQRQIDPKLIDSVPDALALYQKQKEENSRATKLAQSSTKPGARKDYGGLYKPGSHTSQWKSLEPKPKKKEFNYY